MKLLKYDKKTWGTGETSYTWQFVIFKNRSFLWVNYENPTRYFWSSGGFYATFSLLANSLFGVELKDNKQCLAFEFFSEFLSELGEE
jgi:hypothetical protein